MYEIIDNFIYMEDFILFHNPVNGIFMGKGKTGIQLAKALYKKSVY